MGYHTVGNWSGGITDEYLDAPDGMSKKLHNLFINRVGKAVQRPALSVIGTAPQIPAGNQQIDSLYYFDNTIFVKSGTNLYYLDESVGGIWSTLLGPTGHVAFPDSELGAKCTWSEWRGHLIITPAPSLTKKGGCRAQKVYRLGATGAWTLVQAGMPRAADGTVGGITGSMTYSNIGNVSYSYIWYHCFYRSYAALVNGVSTTFEDYGSPNITQDAGYAMGPGVTQSQTTDGTLDFANSSLENYDTTNMTVRTFRTKANGVVPYYAFEDVLGGSLHDDLEDSALTFRAYPGLEDGNFNDPPPVGYFHTVVDGIGWYFGGVDITSGQLYSNRVWAAKPGDFNGVPSGNYCNVEGDIATAFDHAGVHPVAFFRNRCYRIEGRIDALGAGVLRAVRISSTEGSLSADVCRTSDGIYFVSENGFCYTNGFQVVNFSSKHLRATFKALGSKSKASAAYDAENRRVFFGMESSTLSSLAGANNCAFIMDENFSQSDQGAFMTMGSDSDFRPTAMHYDSRNNRLLFGDKGGFIYSFDDTKLFDQYVNPASFNGVKYTKAIVWDWISVAWSFGDTIATKWVPNLYATCKNLTGRLSMDLFSINDDSTDDVRQLAPVRERKTTATGIHRISRFFPRKGLRCTYKQIQAKKGLVVLYGSDALGKADVTLSNLGVTLSSGYWPLDEVGESLVGQSIYFDFDNYTQGFPIAAQAGDVLTVTDAHSLLQETASSAWEIRGYPKDEGVEMHAFEVDYESDEVGEVVTKMGESDSQ